MIKKMFKASFVLTMLCCFYSQNSIADIEIIQPKKCDIQNVVFKPDEILSTKEAMDIFEKIKDNVRAELDCETIRKFEMAKIILKANNLMLATSNNRCCKESSPYDVCNTAAGKYCAISTTAGQCVMNSDNC